MWRPCVVAVLVMACAPASTLTRAEREDLALFCVTHACRPVRPGHPPLPYVENETAFVYPGESFAITGDLEQGRLVRVRYAAPEEAVPKVTLTLWQEVDRGALRISSTFPARLEYDAALLHPSADLMRPITSCPLPANGGGSETWPSAARAVMVKNFRVIADDAPEVCGY